MSGRVVGASLEPLISRPVSPVSGSARMRKGTSIVFEGFISSGTRAVIRCSTKSMPATITDANPGGLSGTRSAGTVGVMAKAAEHGAPVPIEVAGRVVEISSPDKVMFPERGETKLDLANYYVAVGEPLLATVRTARCCCSAARTV